MLTKGVVLFLLTVWLAQCSVALKNQTLLAVKKANNRITIKPKHYTVKPEEIIVGHGKYIDSTNHTGYVIFFYKIII